MNRDKIDELIARASDPVQQATLLVLANFDTALESNTRATEAIARDVANHRDEFKGFVEKVDSHIKMDRDMLVSIRAGWWVGLMFLSLVNLLGGWVITRAVSSNDEQDRTIRALEISVQELKGEVKLLRQQHNNGR